jgi:hypothetical protein
MAFQVEAPFTTLKLMKRFSPLQASFGIEIIIIKRYMFPVFKLLSAYLCRAEKAALQHLC